MSLERQGRELFERAKPYAADYAAGSSSVVEADCPVCGSDGELRIEINKGLWGCAACGERGGLREWLSGIDQLDEQSIGEIMANLRSAPSQSANKTVALPATKRPPHIYRYTDGVEAGRTYSASRGRGLGFSHYLQTPRGWVEGLMPGKRVMYNLMLVVKDAMAKKPNQVLVFGDERSADRCVELLGRPSTTFQGPEWVDTDWEPLAKRQVLVVSDRSARSRRRMGALAKHLEGLGAAVRVAFPPGTDGRRACELKTEGQFESMLRESVAPLGGREEEPEVEGALVDRIRANEHFEVLGMRGNQVVFRRRTTWRMYEWSAGQLGRQGLLVLAPVAWWRGVASVGGKTLAPRVVEDIVSAIIRVAEGRGEVDRRNIRGLGGTLEGERVLYFLGNGLWEPSTGGFETSGEGLGRIYVSGNAKLSVGEVCEGELMVRFARLMEQYRWADRASYVAFLGWMASSLAGGCLRWRPHAWLQADNRTGKSWLISEVLGRVLGNWCHLLGDVSAAAVAEIVGSDSLPVVVDEAEYSTAKQGHVAGVLELMRYASDGQVARARAGGGKLGMSVPRSSFMLSGADVMLPTEGDRQRITLIQFGKAMPSSAFERFSVEVAEVLEAADSIRNRLLVTTGDLLARAEVMRKQMMLMDYPTTRAMQSSALMAGYSMFCNPLGLGMEGDVLGGWMEDTGLLAGNLAALTISEVQRAKNALMKGKLRLRGREMQVETLLRMAKGGDKGSVAALGNAGLKFSKEGRLLVGVGLPDMERMMKLGGFGDKRDYANLLLRLPGAEQMGGQISFGSVRVRPLSLDLAAADIDLEEDAGAED